MQWKLDIRECTLFCVWNDFYTLGQVEWIWDGLCLSYLGIWLVQNSYPKDFLCAKRVGEAFRYFGWPPRICLTLNGGETLEVSWKSNGEQAYWSHFYNWNVSSPSFDICDDATSYGMIGLIVYSSSLEFACIPKEKFIHWPHFHWFWSFTCFRLIHSLQVRS